MKRLLPHPLLSLVLWATWLALNNTLAPAHVLLGAVLSWVLPLTGLHLTDGTWPRLHRPIVALRLTLCVLRDIVVSNVEVARRVLGPDAAIHPGFVKVPPRPHRRLGDYHAGRDHHDDARHADCRYCT